MAPSPPISGQSMELRRHRGRGHRRRHLRRSGTAFGAFIGAALIEVSRNVSCCLEATHSGRARSLAAGIVLASCLTAQGSLTE